MPILTREGLVSYPMGVPPLGDARPWIHLRGVRQMGKHHRRLRFLLPLISGAALWGQGIPAQDPPRGLDSPAIVAAELLGKAITTVADHIKPAVVSVYAAKMAKPRNPEAPDDPTRRFEGRREFRVPE